MSQASDHLLLLTVTFRYTILLYPCPPTNC